jgi:hypothetical protein
MSKNIKNVANYLLFFLKGRDQAGLDVRCPNPLSREPLDFGPYLRFSLELCELWVLKLS